MRYSSLNTFAMASLGKRLIGFFIFATGITNQLTAQERLVVDINNSLDSTSIKDSIARRDSIVRMDSILRIDSTFKIARNKLDSQKYGDAKAICHQLLALHPDYKDAWVLLGRIYYSDDMPDSARHILKGLNDTAPDEDAYTVMAENERWLGNYRSSLKYSDEGLSHFPESGELIAVKAVALFEQNRKTEAFTLLSSYLAKKPDDNDARLWLGRMYYWENHWNNHIDSALYELQTVANKKPSEDVYVTIADIERWIDSNSSSLKYSEAGLQHFPSSQELHMRKAQALDALHKSDEARHFLDSIIKNNPGNYNDRVWLAKLYSDADKNDSAKAEYMSLLAKTPWEDAYSGLWDVESKMDSNKSALTYANEGLAYFPGSGDLITRKAKSLAALNMKNEAKNVLDTFLLRRPSKFQARVALGNMYYRNGRNDSALYEIKMVLEQVPNEDAYNSLCDIERWIDNPTASLQYADEGLTHFPGSDVLLLQRAKALNALKRNHDALSITDSILFQNPDNSDARIFLAQLYFGMHKADSACYELKIILQRKHDEDAYNSLSEYERWTDSVKTSLHYANEGLEYYPSSEDLTINKAWALYELDSVTHAFHILDTLLQRDENNADARQLAELILMKLNKNIFTLSYTYDHWSNEFPTDWSLVSASYTRHTNTFGNVVFQLNWAERYKVTGEQVQLAMYPTFGRKTYLYVTGGYSPYTLGNDDYIFPQYSAGATIFRSFPHAFEGSLGYMWLDYTPLKINTFTVGVGKYYKNLWFNILGFITLYDTLHLIQVAQSYEVTVRLYTKSILDYFNIAAGYGVSPDAWSNEALVALNPFYHSYYALAGYQFTIKRKNLIYISAEVTNTGYYLGDNLYYGNDYTLNVTYRRYF